MFGSNVRAVDWATEVDDDVFTRDWVLEFDESRETIIALQISLGDIDGGEYPRSFWVRVEPSWKKNDCPKNLLRSDGTVNIDLRSGL